jgi:hypothetical protein
MSVGSVAAVSAGVRFVRESGAMPALSFPALDVPFAHQPSAEDLHDVAQRHLAFLGRYRLVEKEPAEQRRFAKTIAGLAMALFPRSEGARLDIAVDALSWSVAWRDCCASLQTQDPFAAQALTWQVVELTFQDDGVEPEHDAPLLVRAFSDVWRRETEGMSLDWKQHAQANWRSWLLALIHPDRFGAAPSGPYLLGYQAMDWRVLSDLIEGSSKFELSLDVRETTDIAGLLDMYVDLNQWQSDMCAASACGARPLFASNVFWLQLVRACTREEAIRELARLHGRVVDRWRAWRARLPLVCTMMRLGAGEQHAMERYVTALEALTAGYYTWLRAAWPKKRPVSFSLASPVAWLPPVGAAVHLDKVD